MNLRLRGFYGGRRRRLAKDEIEYDSEGNPEGRCQQRGDQQPLQEMTAVGFEQLRDGEFLRGLLGRVGRGRIQARVKERHDTHGTC